MKRRELFGGSYSPKIIGGDMTPGSVWMHGEFEINEDIIVPVATFVVLDEAGNCLYLRNDYEQHSIGRIERWDDMPKSSWDTYKRIV